MECYQCQKLVRTGANAMRSPASAMRSPTNAMRSRGLQGQVSSRSISSEDILVLPAKLL